MGERVDRQLSPPKGSLHRGRRAENRQAFSWCQRGLPSYITAPWPAVNGGEEEEEGLDERDQSLTPSKDIIMFAFLTQRLSKEPATKTESRTNSNII